MNGLDARYGREPLHERIRIGVALEAAYNRPGPLDAVYRGPAILVLAHLARFGIVAALLARWVAVREPSSCQVSKLRQSETNGS